MARVGDKLLLFLTFREMYDSDKSSVDARKQIEGLDLRSLLLDSVTDSIFVHDFEGNFYYFNEAAYSDRGYTKEELMRLKLHDLDIPEYSQLIESRMQKLNEENQIAFESAHQCKDGNIVNVENRARIIRYGGQKLILTVSRDITEQKEAEKRLKENEERYRKLVEYNPVAIAVHSEGKIVYCNEATLKLMGTTSKEDVVGKPVLDFVHPDYKETALNRINLSQEEQIYGKPVEEKFLCPDRKVIDVEVTAIPTTYDGKPAIQVVVRDITEKKVFERALMDSEKKYRDMVENINEVIYSINTQGIITYISPVVENLSGYTPSEVTGKHFIDFIHPEDIEEVKKNFREGLANKNRPSEFRVLTKSGDSLWVSSHGRAIKEDKKTAGMQAVLTDITKRKKAEKELKNSEKKYRTTFEHTGTAMTIIEEDTTVSLVNEEFEKLSGYNKNEIEDKVSFTEFVHPDDLERLKEYHYARRRGEDVPNEYEARLIHKDGNVRNVYFTLGMIPGTGQSVASLMDITYTKRLDKLLSIVSNINELVGREHNPTVVLEAVCERLNTLYEAVFTSIIKEGKPQIIRSEGFSSKTIDRIISKCPSVSRALNGDLMKLSTDSELCQQCTGVSHNYVLSIPLVYEKQHGVITIHSISDFYEGEIEMLDKVASNIAFALSAYELEKEREFAVEQLLKNLKQFDKSADRLRNPLAVIMSSLEMKKDYEKEKILRVVEEQTMKIKEELDELRKEETNTFELIEKFGARAEKFYEAEEH